MLGWSPREIKRTVDDAADKLQTTAADTRSAMVALAVLAVAALVIAGFALAVAVGKD